MKKTVVFLLAFLPALLFAQSHKWHGTNQDAIYPDTNLLDSWEDDSLVISQTYTGIGEGYGSPSIIEDGIFIAGMSDSIGSIHKYSHNGEKIWSTIYGYDFTYKYRGSRGTPTLHENKLYYSGAYGDALCLDMKTGDVIWHVNIFDKYDGELIKWGYTESPLIYKDMVILQPGGPNVSLCALNKNDGSVVWETNIDGSANAYSTPKLFKHDGETLCMVNLSFHLVIFEPSTGNVKIKHPLTNSRENHTNEPIYRNGQIFYSSGYGEGSVMFKINDEEMKLDTIWQNTEFDSKLSGIQIVNGLIYGTADKKKEWAVIRWDNGEEVFSTRDMKPGSLISADGKFYIFTDNGEIVLAKPTAKGIDIANRFPCPAYPAASAFSHPVIYKGDLFIRFNDNLWRYKIAK